jgi:thiamine transport system permease protein
VFWLAGRSVVVADAGEPIRGRLRGAVDWLAVIFGWLVAVGLMLPVIAVVLASFPSSPGAAWWQNFANLGGQGARDVLNVSVAQALGNSLRNLLLTFAVGFGGGVAIARGLAYRRVRGWHSVFMLPMATSAVVLGLGYLLAFARPPLNLLESWAAVPLAQALIVLPLVIRLVQPAIQASDRHLVEAAQVDGANAWRTWWLIQVPILRPALSAAAAMAALSAIGEFGVASMLVYGDQETLSTVLYRLMARPGTENFGMAMAASTLLILAALAVVLVLTASETQRSGQPRQNARA